MSYGVPVIVSDIPANLEVGLDKNRYFKLGNIGQLATMLQENINGDCVHVDYDMSKYDWDRIADQVAELYS